jgi:predicted methyltransferase
MPISRSVHLALVVLPLFGSAVFAQQAPPTPFQENIRAAMQADIRSPQERARDVNRLPVEILSFFRMREDMRVIEILPASGWFTKLLGPALKDKGKLYVAHPEGMYADLYRPIAKLPGLENVEEIELRAEVELAKLSRRLA